MLKNIKEYKNIYMIGIGGISMSGIAEILKSWNFTVSGSDMNESEQTKKLFQKGIKIYIGQTGEYITNEIDLIIYTAAIKETNPEFIKGKELKIEMVERGIFLGELTKLFENTIGIAGTHGKTSTTSMVIHTFIEGKLDPSAQVGANLNILNGNYRIGKSKYFIIEACEYSDSYLNFKQKSAIILNIDNDHLDYFKNIENIENSFQKYVSHLPKDGILILNNDDKRVLNLKNYSDAKIITVGKDNSANWYYDNLSFDENGHSSYDLYHNNNFIKRIQLKVPGKHNVFNSICTIALASAYNINIEDIQNGLLKFTGASRRFEYKGLFKNVPVYDDYAHHPTEITATAESLNNKTFNKSWVIFEPHTYSRLKNHLNEFAISLSNFDNIIMTDIYAAREINTFNISENNLIEEAKKLGKTIIHINDYTKIKEYLANHIENNDIILTIGAGNITKLASLLTK